MLCALSELALYFGANFYDKELVLKENPEPTPSAPNSTASTELEVQQILPPPPLDSILLGILFSATIFRIWCIQRKNSIVGVVDPYTPVKSNNINPGEAKPLDSLHLNSHKTSNERSSGATMSNRQEVQSKKSKHDGDGEPPNI